MSHEVFLFNPATGEPRCRYCGAVPPFPPGACPNNVSVQPQQTGVDSAEVEKVLDCTVIIKSPDGARGHGIIVAPKKLLTALHGCFQNNSVFEIVDRHGNSRHGFVRESWYHANIVDIALIELNEDSTSFDSFMPVRTTPVKLGDRLSVISRRAVPTPEEYAECLETTAVTVVVRNTSLIHSTYYAETGMSGCSVVATRVGNSFALVGVHVAKHDTTTAVEPLSSAGPPSKKRKHLGIPVTREEFDEAMMTVDSDIHGHGSYCLICEIARVDGLLEMLD